MKHSYKSKRETSLSYLFLVPLFVILILFMAYPFISGIILSLKDDAGTLTLRNFTSLLSESRFATNMKKTVIYVIMSVSLSIILALIAAHIITKKTKLVSVLRPLYLIPWIIPPVASGTLFRSMFDGNAGPIPKLLKMISGKTILPIGDMNLSIWSCVLHEFWRSFPFAMLFIAAGLTTISQEYYEAAEMDGAGKWKQFCSITLPLIKPHLFIVILMVTNSTLQSTEAIYTLTSGGPGYSSETIAVRMFRSAFVYNETNLGAALGVILLFITVILMVIYNRALNMKEVDN